MYKFKYSFATLVFLMAISLTSCETSSTKDTTVKEDINNELDNQKEWVAFQESSIQKIVDNQAKINTLKAKMKESGAAFDQMRADRIERLEKQNNDLSQRMDNYDAEHSDWNSFKREFNHDMDEIGNSLKSLSDDDVN